MGKGPFDNPITKEFMSLFENSKVLALRHHKRAFSADVLRATKVYLQSNRVDYNTDLFDDLINSLKDKNIIVLADKFDIVARDVLSKIAAMGAKNERRNNRR
jgi:hypothetical protein